ncbi:TPA: hypothetical protein N0F65_001949, partial [Lagenidium giganteum]
QRQERRVDRAFVGEACISKSTKSAYKSCINGIRKWLYSARSSSEPYFDADGDLNQFLLAKVNDPAKQLCATTLSGFRSAVKDVYRRKRIPLPAAYDEDFKPFFSGIRRIQTEKLQKGGSKDCGKQPLTYSLYMQLCTATLASGDGGVGHLFLITQWNLMCRSKSVETVHLDHLLHHLPEGFQFPSTDIHGAWMLRWFGCHRNAYPPFRVLTPLEFATKAARHSFSEWSILMRHMEGLLMAHTEHVPSRAMTEEQATIMLSAAIAHLPAHVVKNHRTLKVSTVLRLVRESQYVDKADRRRVPFKARKRRSRSSLS